MKLSELIADAEKTLKDVGDIPVVVPDSGCGCCKSYIYDPASTELDKEAETYSDDWKSVVTHPIVYLVS
ncbi:hypothetical protein OH797_32055 [Streptomyces anulatus]|uniref:hypothetical protein n=1 Tax=Streptomyces anulatus TaxID=1892 RepID=UPI00386C74E7